METLRFRFQWFGVQGWAVGVLNVDGFMHSFSEFAEFTCLGRSRRVLKAVDEVHQPLYGSIYCDAVALFSSG